METLDESTNKFILEVIAHFGKARGLKIRENVSDLEESDGIETDCDTGFGYFIMNVLTSVQQSQLVQGVYQQICDLLNCTRSATAVAKDIIENKELSEALLQRIISILRREGTHVYDVEAQRQNDNSS